MTQSDSEQSFLNLNNHENSHRALLLVGSPKRKKSTSFLLGNYLLEQLRHYGFNVNTFMIHDIVQFPSKLPLFYQEIKNHGILIMAQPLYFDSLPYPVIKALELLNIKQEDLSLHTKKLLVIMNNGFPEPHHNYVAIDILRCFAEKTGMEWLGSLALAMGPVLSPKNFNFFGKNAKKALQLTANALHEGKRVPDVASHLMERKIMPYWIYKYLAHYSWKSHARKNAKQIDLHARPHE